MAQKILNHVDNKALLNFKKKLVEILLAKKILNHVDNKAFLNFKKAGGPDDF